MSVKKAREEMKEALNRLKEASTLEEKLKLKDEVFRVRGKLSAAVSKNRRRTRRKRKFSTRTYDINSGPWMHDKRIRERYMEIMGGTELNCPECGSPDRRNTKDGEPWCFKCDVPLIKKGEKYDNIKLVREDKDTLRKLRGLPERINANS